MIAKLLRVGFVCWFALAQTLLGVSAAYAQSGAIDVEPPLIEHDVVSAVEADIRQSFFASVVDDNQLDSVSLYYRFENDPAYSSVLMNRVSYSSTYIAHIPTDASSDRNIEYYIQARDKAGNRTVRGYAFNPLVREIRAPESAASSTVADNAPAAKEPITIKRKTAVYVVLGVLALGFLASSATGGDSTPTEACPNDRCTISVIVGQP